MQFHVYLTEIATAVRTQNGEKLGSLLSLDDAHLPKLLMAMHDSSVRVLWLNLTSPTIHVPFRERHWRGMCPALLRRGERWR